jgi:prephenate dehydrogenase
MQRVAIIGLGLIGGSIGLGLRAWSRENNNALRIVGFDANIDHQQQAIRRGCVDSAEWTLPKAVADADVIILATPVGAMREIMADMAPRLKQGAIVTDAGSTKSQVLAWANELLPESVSFVGGHPMAGKSESIEAADGDLFRGATWCLCPSVRASETAIRNVLGMVNALGAEAFFVDPDEHDAFVGGVSHLPFVVSAALMNALSRDHSWRDMKTLSATGFRDTTRLALGSPEMHRDIALTNRDALIRWIDQLTETLSTVRADLTAPEEEARERLTAFFTEAQDARAAWEVGATRSAEQAPSPVDELPRARRGQQMSRMFLGGFGRRRRDPRRP